MQQVLLPRLRGKQLQQPLIQNYPDGVRRLEFLSALIRKQVPNQSPRKKRITAASNTGWNAGTGAEKLFRETRSKSEENSSLF